MNTTLFSFLGPMLDLFLETILVVENIVLHSTETDDELIPTVASLGLVSPYFFSHKN